MESLIIYLYIFYLNLRHELPKYIDKVTFLKKIKKLTFFKDLVF